MGNSRIPYAVYPQPRDRKYGSGRSEERRDVKDQEVFQNSDVVDEHKPGDHDDRDRLLETLGMTGIRDNGISYNPTLRPAAEFDWNLFWQFTSRHQTFNR